ncbi:hypothetical protein C5167_039547 [Papaver somniferum]|uniref:Uncharacterized protein n=1 Tax=Papaver somniferum TaxID=3469 RepID=A0A4Y7IEX0_PAPSO|nr:hypothetical protein C5167_039547 [Papaver somniferum]
MVKKQTKQEKKKRDEKLTETMKKLQKMNVGHCKGSLLFPYSEHEKVFVQRVGEENISLEEYINPELQVADGNEKRVAGSEENVGAGSSVNKEHIANE